MINIYKYQGVFMKKLTMVFTLVTSFLFVANAESIDGTLAVDSANSVTGNTQQPANNQLSATNSYGSSDLDKNAKDTQQPSSMPLSPSGGSSYLEGPFVGVEASGVLASQADGVSSSGVSFGLRFGAQNTEWRTMAVLESYSNSDSYNGYLRGLLQLDYYFLGMDNLMIDAYAIRPYAGVNAGAMSLDTQSANVKTLVYGAQLGATMNITNQIDFDLGYRYDLSSSERVDHTSGIAVGLHYKY